jgi:hypothetical protein
MAWKITVQAARKTAGKPQDVFLMVDGLKIARRGYPDTPEAGTWVPIEPGWEVKDVLGGDEIWVRYTNPVSGEVITFPEGGRQDHNNRWNRERFSVIYPAQKLEGKMTSKEVEQAIRAIGLAVTRVDGKWRINYRGGKEATAYYTTDDDDALGMARAMEVARGQQWLI